MQKVRQALLPFYASHLLICTTFARTAQARHRAKRKAYIEQVRYPAPAPQSPHTPRKCTD